MTKRALDKDPELKARVNEKLAEVGLEYKGTSEIKHFLYAIIDEYGLENVKDKVTVPLSHLNIAPFYGCHNIRPSELHEDSNNHENSYKPKSLDNLISALEGNPVNYESKNKCCGFHVELQANQNGYLPRQHRQSHGKRCRTPRTSYASNDSLSLRVYRKRDRT